MNRQLGTILALFVVAGGGAAAGVALSSTPDTVAPPAVVQTVPAAPALASVDPASVGIPEQGRTVIVVREAAHAASVPTKTKGNHVTEPKHDTDAGEQMAGPSAGATQMTPVEPVQAVEVDPTPEPTPKPQLPTSDGNSTMKPTGPDPVLGGVSEQPHPFGQSPGSGFCCQ